jgi:hypothetical protein
MAMKSWLRAATIAVCAVLTMAWSSVRADPVPLVTGEHWVNASVEQKKAYLIGVANVITLDATYSGMNIPSDVQSLIPRFARGLKGQTLDSARQTLDQWYAGHPDKLKRPVIETIWFELVEPGLKKNS